MSLRSATVETPRHTRASTGSLFPSPPTAPRPAKSHHTRPQPPATARSHRPSRERRRSVPEKQEEAVAPTATQKHIPRAPTAPRPPSTRRGTNLKAKGKEHRAGDGQKRRTTCRATPQLQGMHCVVRVGKARPAGSSQQLPRKPRSQAYIRLKSEKLQHARQRRQEKFLSQQRIKQSKAQLVKDKRERKQAAQGKENLQTPPWIPSTERNALRLAVELQIGEVSWGSYDNLQDPRVRYF